MRSLRWVVAIPVLLLATLLHAQVGKREPLSADQIEQIREAGVYPDGRVNLYTKFLNEHAEVIKGLTGRIKSSARSRRLNDELQDFTALMDEFGSNLDMYSDRHADIRVSLKPLPAATERWLSILRALGGEPGFDLARKEAIESAEDLTDQCTRLLSEQTEYFNLHKDEKGQQRAEPK